MALFTSYAPPGIYTTEIFNSNTASAVGTARIPVILGEGVQYFTFSNIELFRGSSSNTDDQSVNENISDQVNGLTQNFRTTYHPVVLGDGTGTPTNLPQYVQVQAIYPNGNVIPVTVISLNGLTGQFMTQDIIPAGTDLTISYYFKRGDTLVANEDDSFQIPQYATQVVTAGGTLTLSLTNPGRNGNNVTLQFVAGANVPDSQAVNGAGTNAIVINVNSNSPTPVRTLTTLAALISAGIPTLDGSYITVTASSGSQTTAITAGAAVPFAGGAGPASNTVFQVRNFPITDGTGGGVTSNSPASVTAQVNGVAATVASVDGALGLVTMAQPVTFGSTLTFTYFYNTWQNTFDLLPSANVSSIVEVGLGPNREDFAQGVDYVLGTALDSHGNVMANTVNWGNNVSEAIGESAAGELANFTPAEVLTTLVDEKVYLRPATGAVNGRNTVFQLQDTPTDGNGVPTDDAGLIKVYVGSDPLTAFEALPVAVASLNGQSGQVTLYNAPIPNTNPSVQPAEAVGVWASYSRNTLASHQYAVKVIQPGFVGLGTYQVADELGRVAPLVYGGSTAQTPSVPTNSVVADSGFASTGALYPNTISFDSPYQSGDAQAQAGAAVDEAVTLTFRNDGNSSVIPAVQASLTSAFGSTGGSITFTASIPGTNGDNVQIALDAVTQNPVPVTVVGDLVTIYPNWTGTLETISQIVAHFPSAETASGGQIVVSAFTAGTGPTTTAAQNLAGGADGKFTPVTHSYTVSSSALAAGSNGVGYLNQTYIDAKTGFRVTVVRPQDAVAYGITATITPYNYGVGDHLDYAVKVATSGANAATRYCGTPGVLPAYSNNAVAVPGLTMEVITNFNSTAGDTVVVSTFKASGDEPSIGTFYYVTFTTSKVAADYALKIYTSPSVAYANYGQPSTVNRLSLGIQLMAQNGVQTFGAIQIPVQPGTNIGSPSDYISALQQLTFNLPGFNTKANVVVPLSNDPSVAQALSRQLTSQATARYKGEAIGFVGFSQFTSANQARAYARSLLNQRIIAIGNAAAGILITDPTTGVAVEYLVDGPFMGAAMAGLNCNPANDVATTLTLQNLTGFSRLLITYDDATMDLMASDGLTMLLDNNGALQIRHYKTTDPRSTLVSEPTSTTIADYVAQQFRLNLQQFIGRKLVDALVTDITVVCNSLLQGLQGSQIIDAYENLAVLQNQQDPTEVDVTVTFKPIFSLLYLSVTFTVQTSL